MTIRQCLSYVYIMALKGSSWIFMPHCNWNLSMEWNTVLLEGYLPWDTNLNLHIVLCIQISATDLNVQAGSVQIWSHTFIWAWTHIVSAVRHAYATCFPLSLLIWQCNFTKILTELTDKHCFLCSSKTTFLQTHGNHLMLWLPGRTQCMGTMNTASFSSYIKITAFSLPWSNNWRKDLDLFSPLAANLIFIAQDIMCKPIPNPLFQSTFPLSQ